MTPPPPPPAAVLPAGVPGFTAPAAAALGGQPAFAAFQQPQQGAPDLGASAGAAPAFQAEQSLFGGAAPAQPHVADLGLTGSGVGGAGAGGGPSGGPDPFAGLGF